MGRKKRSYFEAERPEVLNLIPNTVSKTIEFGCGNGNFSKSIKDNFETESWGVDIDEASAKNATLLLDNVIQGEAMQVLKKLPKNYFDCVICNDFLEHIVNPTEFLVALRPYLTNSALLICSLPNVRHWKNLGELLFDKDWRYREEGILDSTHLRFFTKKSMLRMLDDSGLKIEEIKGINAAKSLRFHIPNILTFGIHNDMKFLQFIIRAKF